MLKIPHLQPKPHTTHFFLSSLSLSSHITDDGSKVIKYVVTVVCSKTYRRECKNQLIGRMASFQTSRVQNDPTAVSQMQINQMFHLNIGSLAGSLG